MAAVGGALLLAACSSAPSTAPGPRYVTDLPAEGPAEVISFNAATLIPEIPCDPATVDRASCTVVSAMVPGDGDALAAVIRTSRGGITTFVLAGRSDDATIWSHDPTAAPPACIAGPGPERFACLLTEGEGSSWVVYDVATGEEAYRSEVVPAISPPIVSPGHETVYSVWADGSPERAVGVVLALGPDRTRWATDVIFTVPPGSADAGFVIEGGDGVVVTGAAVDDDGEWRRLAFDPASGAAREGESGVALLDVLGHGLARDGDALVAGSVPVAAPEGAQVAQPIAVDDLEDFPVTVLLADGALAAYSPADGAALWQSAGAFEPWAACEGALVGTGDGSVVAVGVADGAELWRVEGAVGEVGFAWCAPGAAVLLDGGRLAAFSLTDGALAWELDLGVAAGSEVAALRPAGVRADGLALLVIGAGETPDGAVSNQLLVVR